MKEYFAAEKENKDYNYKTHESAQKVLYKYITQLKIHYDFSDAEVLKILKAVTKDIEKRLFKKKWWQIW